MASRASYRNEVNLNILKKRGFRYFFSIGGIDKRVRQAGQAKARYLLRQIGLRYVFFKIPRAKHSVILPEAPFMKALEFVMFGNDGGMRVMGGSDRPATAPREPPKEPKGRPAVQTPAVQTPPEQPREPDPRPLKRRPRERPARVQIRRLPEPLKKTTVVRPSGAGAAAEPGRQIPWPEPLIEDDD